MYITDALTLVDVVPCNGEAYFNYILLGVQYMKMPFSIL